MALVWMEYEIYSAHWSVACFDQNTENDTMVQWFFFSGLFFSLFDE